MEIGVVTIKAAFYAAAEA